MDAAFVLLALLAAGVNFGWQPADDADGYEYVVQIEPQLLDVLKSDRKVPIESNVPPEIAPIRKVSIVVGRGDLPRTTVEPVNHTANFAGQSGWTPDRYEQSPPSAVPSNDRYTQPPGIRPTAIQPPPTLTDRARSALRETGNTLRDGLEAGIQAANAQLQGLSGETARPPAATSRSRGNVAPPPWTEIARLTQPDWSTEEPGATEPPFDPTASPGMVPTRTASGWTSIGTDVAAPPLLVPRLAAAPATASPPLAASSQNSLNFPPATSASESNRSVLSQSSRNRQPPAAPADNWVLGGEQDTEEVAAPPTFARADSVAPLPSAAAPPQNNLLSLQPPQSATEPLHQQQPAATNPWTKRWEDDERWNQPPQSLPDATAAEPPRAAKQVATSHATENKADSGLASDQRYALPPAAAVPKQAVAEATPAQPPQQAEIVPPDAPIAAAAAPLYTTTTAPTAQPPAAVASAAEQPPWLPLLVVSLLLLGSVGANFFLGWSYFDARQKYRNLVRKTAAKFHRAATSAA
jgi:hypothetical protein